MATPNKFSNPDTPMSWCLCAYAKCLVVKPLQAIFCLPCTCCAWELKNRSKQREASGANIPEVPISEQPAPAQPMQGDASKPRDQWPSTWRDPVERREHMVEAEQPSEKKPSLEDKFVKGVLKATQ
ncbi:hypothetical protein F4778DRAFT_787559 [Xylariomycetidae sp. FL2044]|nr:hypothetical protein F4778DRAFT_787559 [Xylariomycetidae sp. FL2044]